jgi:hypothetical protein
MTAPSHTDYIAGTSGESKITFQTGDQTMKTANIALENEYTLDQLIELADITNDDHETPWEAFNDEIDT